MYNFRCRTRIAGGFMIRDYVANQSKDNNKKNPHSSAGLFGGAYDTLYEPFLYRKFTLSATFNYTILKK